MKKGAFGVSQRSSKLLLLHSDDLGATWSEASVIFPQGRGAFVRAPILLSGDESEWLLPLYFTPDGEFVHTSQYAAILRSADFGQTWTDEAEIPRTIVEIVFFCLHLYSNLFFF